MSSFSHSALWNASAWDRQGRRLSGRQLPAGLGDDRQLVPDELPQNRRGEHPDLLVADPELQGVAIAERPAPPAGMEGHEAQVSGQARRRHDGVM
jgi:hypothetical protein